MNEKWHKAGTSVNHRQGTIGFIPLFSILILAIGLMNHVMVIPPLISEAHRDAWISVLLMVAPFLLWTFMLHYIMKRTNQQPLLTWFHQRYGPIAGISLRLFFLLYLFFIHVLTLKDTVMWTHVTYLPRTPQFVLSVSLLLLCFFGASYGLQAIAITSGFLLPFVLIFGEFVMTTNLPVKDYSLLTPVLEQGMAPVWRGSVFVGGGLAELILLLLFQQHLNCKVRLWSLWLLVLFLLMLVLGPTTGAIAEFGPFEAASLRYPAFEEWRLVRVGKYIQHVDFLSIYQWLSGAFVRIAITLYLMLELLAGGTNHKRKIYILLSLSTLSAIAVALPVSDMQYLQFLKGVYLPGSLAAVTAVLLFMFIRVLLTKRSKGEKA